MSEHEIKGKSPARYFYMMPNIVAWMHLDPHTRALYDHYCWRINTSANGSGYETTKTTAEFCHMSPAQVRESRNRLHNLGLIQVETRQTEQSQDGKPVFETSLIHINDVMSISMAFEKKEITLHQGVEQIRMLNADLLSRATPEELKVRGKNNTPMRIGDMPPSSIPLLQYRVGGMLQHSTPMPQGSAKQEGIEQEGFKEQKNPPSPSYIDLASNEESQSSQADTKKAKTPKAPTPPVPPAPPSKTTVGVPTPTPIVYTPDSGDLLDSPIFARPDWLPKDVQALPVAPAKKSDNIPGHWGDLHMAILRHWVKSVGKPFGKQIKATEGIYAVLVEKTKLEALSPAIVTDFANWYYSQPNIIKLAREKNELAEHPSEVVSLPFLDMDKVAKQVTEYIQTRQKEYNDLRAIDYNFTPQRPVERKPSPAYVAWLQRQGKVG